MSTKIFDAYRVKKTEIDSIYDLLNDFREDAIEYVRTNEKLLEKIHISAFTWMMLEKATKENRETEIEKFEEDPSWTIREFLKESENSETLRLPLLSMRLRVSVFMDEEYFYLKFFPNWGWGNKFLNQLEDDYYQLEDFHYQNSTDRPEDISQEDYDARDEKWDELTRGNNHYRDGLMYDVFDSQEFWELFTRFFYTGKELYTHLAYDFSSLDNIRKEK